MYMYDGFYTTVNKLNYALYPKLHIECGMFHVKHYFILLGIYYVISYIT